MSKYIDKDKVLEYIVFEVVGKDITCGELRRAIESLPTIEVSDDCISRATALEIFSDLYWTDERLLNFRGELDKVYEKLRTAPSITIEQSPKVGEWIVHTLIDDGRVELECLECGYTFIRAIDYRPHFCENCGAKMGK